MSEMERGISLRSEREIIQDADLVSPGENRLGSAETKMIPTSESHLLTERL